MYGKAGVQVHFKGANTVKELLLVPKDKDHIIQKGEVIYRYICNQPGCTMEYIGETGRNLVKDAKNILGPLLPSLITSNQKDTTSH